MLLLRIGSVTHSPSVLAIFDPLPLPFLCKNNIDSWVKSHSLRGHMLSSCAVLLWLLSKSYYLGGSALCPRRSGQRSFHCHPQTAGSPEGSGSESPDWGKSLLQTHLQTHSLSLRAFLMVRWPAHQCRLIYRCSGTLKVIFGLNCLECLIFYLHLKYYSVIVCCYYYCV